MQVVINDQIVNYTISGNGKKLLILHGWGDSITSYPNLIKELSNKYQVIAVDLPGFGGTKISADNYTLSKYASFVKDFLIKINSEDIYILLGHSNGGAISVKAISENKVHPTKLVLVGASGIRNPDSSKLKALKLFTKTAKVLTSPLPTKTKNNLKGKLYKKIGSDYLVNETLKATFSEIVKEDIRKDMKNVSQPTLLMYSDDDDRTPFAFGETFHQILSNSTLEMLHGGGHFLIHSDPKQIADRIKDFDK